MSGLLEVGTPEVEGSESDLHAAGVFPVPEQARKAGGVVTARPGDLDRLF